MSEAAAPIARRYENLLTRTTLVVAGVVGVGLVAVGLFVPLATRLPLVANGIGCGILASVMVYVLVSLRLDPVRQREQMNELVGQVNTIWYQQFHQRFQEWLPEATYSASEAPRPDLRERFVHLLRSSDRYYFKGATADFTVFRLVALAKRSELQRLSEVRLFVLDPQADRLADRALSAYAVQRLQQLHEPATDDAIERERKRLRYNIYTSIAALFDIRHSRPVSVYFYSDLPFTRCEMFDGGMFLTYYQATSSYPPASLFSANSSHYADYRLNIEMTRRFRTGVIHFDRPGASQDVVDTEAKLTASLRDLGCKDDLANLRKQWSQRFELRKAELESAHINVNDLF
jgi:hypothetical protein